MRNVVTLLALVVCSNLFAAEPDLEEKPVLNGKVSLLVPKGFKVMSEEMLKLKYPRQRPPTLVYSNERGTINIALNHTNDRMSPNQVRTFHKSIEKTFKRLYPSAEWFRSEVTQMHGREFIILDLRTPAIDTRIRNIMIATSLDDRMLLFTFNVTSELEKEWLATGKKIVESVKVK